MFYLMITIIFLTASAFIYKSGFNYAYIPAEEKIINAKSQNILTGFGNQLTNQNRLLHEDILPINEDYIKLGKEVFYQETFGNEVFFSDILGILDGPLTLTNVTKAILKLGGKGTSNLQVELAEDAIIGGREFKKGQKIDTGIDVVKGAFAPLGTKLTYSEGRIKMGVTCTACHATVDRDTGLVIEGAPNSDFNVGLILALAPNSASYFTHTDVKNLEDYVKNKTKKIITEENEELFLPDAEELEEAVDKSLLNWPRGNFDTTIDLINNPTQIPDAFTKDDFPYGWSGFAAIGPFKGLSTFSNNVNAQNTDPLSLTEMSKTLFDIDKELYIATMLQNSANEKYRYDPDGGLRPSQFLREIDNKNPETPGFNALVKIPAYPKVDYFAPSGFIVGSPGFHVGEQVYAMSAYQNAIRPPETKKHFTHDLGERVFEQANCLKCHSGAGFTNNQIISVSRIGTEPSRAQALNAKEKLLTSTKMYAPETSVPIPKNPKTISVHYNNMTDEQLKLAYALGDSPGGYKVKGLIGLQWSAPYLHDGGVAVGMDMENELGLPGTLSKGIIPDPFNSLKALIDRDLRKKVIDANDIPEINEAHVTGQGHSFWVDEEAGFTEEEQEALINYLLSLELKN